MRRGGWFVLAALLFLGWQAWQRHADTSSATPATADLGRVDRGTVDHGATDRGATDRGDDNPRIEREPMQGGFPREVGETLTLIQRGGPFPYDRDGAVFGNFEGRLPRQSRGYYLEYTVPTPGARNRGARRIIAGGQPPSEFWYTGDHYDSFTRIDPGAMQ
ncbi:hypothetical protein BH11PSE14_BH11PSE14_06190 [soil metagenome]